MWFAGIPLRAIYAWLPRPPRTAASAQIASPLTADADLKAYLSHPPCGVRIAGTSTAPVYTYTMAFSMVLLAEAYLMAGEPPPDNLRPAAAPLDPHQTDPRRAVAPGAARPPPTPSPSPATPHGNGCPPSPSPESKRAHARARAPTQSAQIAPHAAALAEQDSAHLTDPPTADHGGAKYRGGVRPHQPCHLDITPR